MANLRLALFASVLLAFASSAFAANEPQAAPTVMPPMPAEVPQMGDLDAVCFVASIEVGGIIKDSASISPDRKADALALTRRQSAYYAGKLTARLPQNVLVETAQKAPGPYFAANARTVRAPVMKWCLHAYDQTVRQLGALDEQAKKLAVAAVDKAPSIDPAKLDGDAKCVVLIGIAVQAMGTQATTDPEAAQRATNLGAAQHFYLGKMSARPDRAKALEALTDVRIYVGQSARARNFTSVRKDLDACILPFSSALATVAKSALAGMPASPKPN